MVLKETVYLLLWEDVGVLQGGCKIEQRPDKWKSAVTLEWLIQHEYMNYVSVQDDLCDLARLVSKSPKETTSL